MKFKFINNVVFAFFIIFFNAAFAKTDEDTISLFPLDNYNQTISHWINPNNTNYDQPLLTNDVQHKHVDLFYHHYFGEASPWNATHVNTVLRQKAPDDLKSIENKFINIFSNQNKSADEIGYGENFRPHDNQWIENIANNINLSQFDNLSYHPENRAIAIDNLAARILPTDDVHFYDRKIAGQGYPFDNLQISALWVGTPVYILTESADHAWSLVLTPDYIGWVKSNGLARMSSGLINFWVLYAKNKLIAITHTQTSLFDETGNFLFSTYIGSVFPGIQTNNGFKLIVPIKDQDQNAIIKYANVSSTDAVSIPYLATPHHFANIMTSMLGRPYGWGSMYFYNDCSQELKSFFTPFGIWLPRNSAYQVTIGKMVDMSQSSKEERLAYLMQKGKPFLTLIYIGGHIILYMGNYHNPNENNALMAMTYQNLWGLRPNPSTRRAVIGKSVLFPMLLQYPEDPNLESLAAKKFFQVSSLDEISNSLLLKQEPDNIKSLMYPEFFNLMSVGPLNF